MSPKEYFDKEYGKLHFQNVVKMNDMVSLYALIEEYEEYSIKQIHESEKTKSNQILKDWLEWEDCIRNFIRCKNATKEFDDFVKGYKLFCNDLPSSAYERASNIFTDDLSNDFLCPKCEGLGWFLDVEAECCNNRDEMGVCCGFPDPTQVQKKCDNC